ncbi:phosphatase domain-containing protein [Methylobacterium sp. 77]|uniref:App1 family protein n=1 Tax=Methylobacterium sp. 77 TaxID=1101192 RepID=UPI00037FC876|nr:phosphatase domain-containing protein [Methylobacterium sp. 77]
MTSSHPPPRRATTRWRKAAGRLLALAARPVRKAQGTRGTVVEAYRGYGSAREIFLIGRVFRQARPDPNAETDDIAADLRDIARRIRRRKVAGASIVARFGGAETVAVTDSDGYFRVTLAPPSLPAREVLWHTVDLELAADPPVHAEGRVFIPPDRCRFVVISDIDDTIMHTGVANKLKMLWRLFVADAEDRVAFPGAAALCRALHAGAPGDQSNPMLYVSRAPWGIYDMLSEFFRQHGIPAGPVLFLREWGLSWRHPLPRRAEDHKRDLIRHMLALYGDLPFVLIGDSGQHDPEVYAKIVSENPGRVLAVYIRNVSRDQCRAVEIERLSQAILQAGSSLVLAADTTVMADHALSLGLIGEEGAKAILAECRTHGMVEAIEPIIIEPSDQNATVLAASDKAPKNPTARV